MIRLVAVICAVVLLSLSSARAQQTYPAFTMVVQTTSYDAKGQMLSVSTQTRYDAANGDWRSVGDVAGYESATVYRRGVGVYASNSRTQRLLKVSDNAPGCPFTTADELRRDSKFKRTDCLSSLVHANDQGWQTGCSFRDYWLPLRTAPSFQGLVTARNKALP